MRVEWNPAKNLANQRKHGVSFEEAAELFTSRRDYLEIFDAQEERFIAIGLVRRGVVLVVWTERDEDVIRIISARWATTREAQMYREKLEHRHEGRDPRTD
ncbi:MAG: BrnT family toxin [Planctomycetota bacterium]